MRLLRDEPHMLSVEELKMIAKQFEIQFAGAQWKVEVFDGELELHAAFHKTQDVLIEKLMMLSETLKKEAE